MAASRPDPFQRRVACILGMPVDVIDMASTVQCVRRAVSARTPLFLSTPNLNFAITSLRDEPFRNSVIDSDLSVADGMPLLWVARLLGVPMIERVAGAALMEQLRREPADDGIAVYFFGGEDGVARAAAERVASERSGLSCAGYESPGFGSVEQLSRPESIERIANSGADFLVVSLGAQKGQAWILRNRASLRVPVVSHLGAVTNFIAGTVRRAPRPVQRLGLEWLWRIKEEPALWRRYLGDGFAFLHVLATRVVPLAWTLRKRPTREQLAQATAAVDAADDQVLVRLTGPWTSENSQRLRAALSRAVEAAIDIRLDLSGTTYVDPECLGLLLLLHGHQRRTERKLRICGVAQPVRRIFVLSCVSYLLEVPHGYAAGTIDPGARARVSH